MKLFRKRDFITVGFILAFSAAAITLFYTILKPVETLPIYQPAEVNKKLVENLNKPSKIWVQGMWETQHDGTKKWINGHWVFREKSFQKKSEILRTKHSFRPTA